MTKKNRQDNTPTAVESGTREGKKDGSLEAVLTAGFERPRGRGWEHVGGYLLAGIIGACAAIVVLVAVVSGVFRGVPYLDRIDITALFSPTTPITIERTERVTVAAEERTAEVVMRITPTLLGIYRKGDLDENLEGLLASAGFPRAHAVALTSDGWLLAAGELSESVAGDLTVLSAEGKSYPVLKRVQDPATGLWLLKVEASTLVAAALRRDTTALGPGTPILLMQFRVGAMPLASPQSAAGIVVLPYRNADRLEERIRLSPPVSGFFIGAPVVTMAGEVAGVVSATDEGGTAFAVPLRHIAAVLDQAFKEEVIVRPSTGLRYIELSQVADVAFALTRGRRQGALLATQGTIPAVAPKSNADEAGLKEGDIITKVEGELVREESDLAGLLLSYPAATTVTLTIVREGEERFIDLPLSSRTPQPARN